MEGMGKTLSHRHSTIGQTALCLHLWLPPHCCLFTCRPTMPAGPIISRPYWRLSPLPSPFHLAGAGHRSSLAMSDRGVTHNSLDHTLCLMLIGLALVKRSVRNYQAMPLRGGLRGKMFEIVFSCKILSRFFPFYPQTFCRFWPSCRCNIISEERDFLYALF